MPEFAVDPDREPCVPLVGEMLSEARDVAWAALERIDVSLEPRLHYRALYATGRLGHVDAVRRGDVVRLLSPDELDVIADCGELLIIASDVTDPALLRKAGRLVEMANARRD